MSALASTEALASSRAGGTDSVLYGSDYPHTIGDMAGCLSRVDALPGDVRDKVRGRNSERIFRL